jgi:X-X-X-Leu-X-X-Gly heptad repeat protein
VVGKSGLLEVHYTVANVTGKAQDVTFDDGTGKMITQSQQVVIPMVGSLTTVLPSSFTDVRSGEASMAGDGNGGTSMTFTMTLFNPIATPTAEFGYSAQIKDGLIPPANVSALPVNPLESPSFKGGAASYKGGADSGITLTAGAVEIDANVLKLRDGAQTLIAGLIQLWDGAKKLNTGLAGEAAPGAFALADGASKLKTGAGQLAAGAGDAKAGSAQLSAGSGQLATGAGKLNVGAGQLKAGLGQAVAGAPALMTGLDQVSAGLKLVDGGLVTMYGGIGQLPTLAQPIHAGIQQMLAGLGNAGIPADTLVYGVDQLRQQIAAAGPGLATMAGGIYTDGSTKATSGAYQKIGCAVRVIDQLKVGGFGKNADGSSRTSFDPYCYGSDAATLDFYATLPTPYSTLAESNAVKQSILTNLAAELTTGQGLLANPGNLGDPASDAFIDGAAPDLAAGATLQQGLTYIQGRLERRAVPGLVKVECGLDALSLGTGSSSPCYSATDVDSSTAGVQHFLPGLTQGLALVDGGVSQLVSGVVAQVQGGIGQAADVAPAQNTLRGGVHAVMGGIDQISAGGLTLLDGLNQLNTGAGALKTGTGELVTGANKLAVGAGQLDTGLGQLSSGGTVQLFDGANKLAAGLGDAATGSGQLADGLTKAVDGGKALPEGAAKLSAEGTSKLVEAGKSTASDYGLKYAVMVAGAERAKTEAMAYGAPADAAGATAYSLEISGANGDGGTDVGRGVGALALFGAGGGLVFFRRRFV